MPSAYLPREGLTLEALYWPFRDTALNPVVTGPILLLLLRYPQHAIRLYAKLPGGARTILNKLLPGLKSMKALFVFGLLRVWNNWYSRRVANNWASDTYDWTKEIVAVSGGSGGIGQLVVNGLAQRGIKVIVLDLKAPEQLPPTAHFYKLDVTNTANIREVASKVRAEHGAPTVLINNAGIAQGTLILESDESALRKLMDVNLMSHFTMAKEFVPSMVEKDHGHIVTVASMASFSTPVLLVDYACSKAAVLSFHEGLSAELRNCHKALKVRTSIVHPIWVRTPMAALLLTNPNFKQFLLEPETVADAIIEQVLSGEGRQIVLPGRFGIMPLARALPEWFGVGLRRVTAENIMPPNWDELVEQRRKQKEGTLAQ